MVNIEKQTLEFCLEAKLVRDRGGLHDNVSNLRIAAIGLILKEAAMVVAASLVQRHNAVVKLHFVVTMMMVTTVMMMRTLSAHRAVAK